VNGGEALVDALLELGVDTGFTVPGESFLNVLAPRRTRSSPAGRRRCS
jgi:thiamine pyrophosphate-dependent acetolactate synthase large subunit-like protein